MQKVWVRPRRDSQVRLMQFQLHNWSREEGPQILGKEGRKGRKPVGRLKSRKEEWA